MPGRDDEISDSPTPPELGHYLGDVDYPVSRDALIEHVEAAGAPIDVRQSLEALEPQDFDSLAAVERAVEALSR